MKLKTFTGKTVPYNLLYSTGIRSFYPCYSFTSKWEDKLHNDGGLPAVFYTDGGKVFYVNGKFTGLFKIVKFGSL